MKRRPPTRPWTNTTATAAGAAAEKLKEMERNKRMNDGGHWVAAVLVSSDESNHRTVACYSPDCLCARRERGRTAIRKCIFVYTRVHTKTDFNHKTWKERPYIIRKGRESSPSYWLLFSGARTHNIWRRFDRDICIRTTAAAPAPQPENATLQCNIWKLLGCLLLLLLLPACAALNLTSCGRAELSNLQRLNERVEGEEEEEK